MKALMFTRRTILMSPRWLGVRPFVLADIGEGITEVEILQWYAHRIIFCRHVREGDCVKQFDKIAEVQSDKASVDITSRYDGKITKLHYKVHDVAKVGQPLIDIDCPDYSDTNTSDKEIELSRIAKEHSSDAYKEKGSSSEASMEKEHGREAKEKRETERNGENGRDLGSPSVRALPSVRVFAKEHKVDIEMIKGSGHDGRVTREDVLAFKQSDSPPYTVARLTAFQKAMVKSMEKALQIPHFGYSDDIDVTTLSLIRKQMNSGNAKITFMPFIIKAVSLALEEHPIINGHYIDGELKMYKKHNFNIAVDTPSGLAVPIIFDIQSKSLTDISDELVQLQSSSKHGSERLKGGSLTISNIGSIGGTLMKPVILHPQVCIGAFGKIHTVPKYSSDGRLSPASVMNVSWSADHRVVDGATMARFSNHVKDLLESPGSLLAKLFSKC